MAKEEGYNISETGNWNVAADYSKLKIMKPLYLSDEYLSIAKYGYTTLFEELEGISQYPLDYLKIKGFERLVGILINLIDNSTFAIKNKKDKEILEDYRKTLKQIEDLKHLLFKTIKNNRENTSVIIIKENHYKKTLNIVEEIKTNINDPLNRNHLIFTDKEEFDPKAYKSKVFEEATTRG